MPHSTSAFYKEDDESRRIMALDSLALGFGSIGVGIEMGMVEMEMGVQMGMGVEIGQEIAMGVAAAMPMPIPLPATTSTAATSTSTMLLKEEEEPEPASCPRRPETTFSIINEPQFIFEFPGQLDLDEEHAHNDGHNGTDNTTLEHDTTLPSSSSNNNNSSSSFISIPSSFSLSLSASHSLPLDSFLGTYHTAVAAGSVPSTSAAPMGAASTALLPMLDEHHLAATSSAPNSSSLRPGTPTTEAMRSMMSVFRVDPFASYDADPGSRRKRRKRGSSYAMLSDPEQTSREEPLMFTFQIEASPDSEYYENYHQQQQQQYHHHHFADIAPPSSAMNLDPLQLSPPQPSLSAAVFSRDTAEYYRHQSSPFQDNPTGDYTSYYHPSALESDNLSNMILTTTSSTNTSNTPASGETVPVAVASRPTAPSTAFSHLYTSYSSTPTHQSHHQQSFHNLANDGHHHYHQNSQSNPSVTSTAYMLQNMRQNMGMNLDNLSNLNVPGMNLTGMDSTPMHTPYQTTASTISGPSNISSINPQRSVISSGLQVSQLDDIIDHFSSRGGDENHEPQWARHPYHQHHSGSYTQSQNKNQGFGDSLRTATAVTAFDSDSVGSTEVGVVGVGVGTDTTALSSGISARKLHRHRITSGYLGESEAVEKSISRNSDEYCEVQNDNRLHEVIATQIQAQGQHSSSDGLTQFGPFCLHAASPVGTGIDAGEVEHDSASPEQGEPDVLGEDKEGNSEIRNLTARLPTYSSPLPPVVVLANANDLKALVVKSKSKSKVARSQQQFVDGPTPDLNPEDRGPSTENTATPSSQIPVHLSEKHSEVIDLRESKECKHGSDLFPFFQDDNDNDIDNDNDQSSPNSVYSDVRELFLREQCDITNEFSPPPPRGATASSFQTDTQSHDATRTSCSSYPLSRTESTYRLNAAQFDPDPEFDSDADVDMTAAVAVDTTTSTAAVVAIKQCKLPVTHTMVRVPGYAPAVSVLQEKQKYGDSAESSTPIVTATTTRSSSSSSSAETGLNSNCGQGQGRGLLLLPAPFATASVNGYATPTPNHEEESENAVDSQSQFESEQNNGLRDRDVGSPSPGMRTGTDGNYPYECFSTVEAAGPSTSKVPSQQSQPQGGSEAGAWRVFEETITAPSPSSQLELVSRRSPQQPQDQQRHPCEIQAHHTRLEQYHNDEISLVSQHNLSSGSAPFLPRSHFASYAPYAPLPAGTEGSKKHICWICQKEFPRPSGLATHMNTHSGLKPYKCPIPTCSKTFAVRSNARRHLRIHGLEANKNLIFGSSSIKDLTPNTTTANDSTSSVSYAHDSGFNSKSLHSNYVYSSTPTAISTTWRLSTPAAESFLPSSMAQCQAENEEICNRNDRSGVCESTTAVIPSCSISSSLRSRVRKSDDVNRKGSPRNYNPNRYPYPSIHLDDPSFSGSGSLSVPMPHVYDQSASAVYRYQNQEDVKTEAFGADDYELGNHMELVYLESNFYSSQAQEPNQEGMTMTTSRIGKVEELDLNPDFFQLEPEASEISTPTKVQEEENGLIQFDSGSDESCTPILLSQVPITTPTWQHHHPGSNSAYVPHGSISDIDAPTPTLSTMSTVSTDSDDLDHAVATMVPPDTMSIDSNARWMTPEDDGQMQMEYDSHVNHGHDGLFGDAMFQPTSSLSPNSGVTLSALSSAYNLTATHRTLTIDPLISG